MKFFKAKLIYLLIFLFLLTGCSNITDYSSDKIIPPNNSKVPIQGTWQIFDVKIVDAKALQNYTIGDSFVFGEDAIKITDEEYMNVQYKIKNVNLGNYFSYNYRLDTSQYIQEKGDVDIIATSVNNKLLYEFIIINKNRLMFYSNKIFYYLKKVDDKGLDKKAPESTISSKDTNATNMDNTDNAGILLGLRDKNNNYRTLWIESKKDIVDSVVECSNIQLPRTNGSFWVLGTRSFHDNKFLFAFPFERTNNLILRKKNVIKITNDEDKILFVGNDYTVLQRADQLQVLPVDELSSPKGVKISDLLGTKGLDALHNSFSISMMSNLNSTTNMFEDKPSEESFKLIRKNGHWIIQGRAFSKDNQSSVNYIDYDVNILPPSNMVHYDELYVDWNKIKEREPEAKDAYTSPNKRIAIVLSDDYIQIYSIIKDGLSKNPIRKISLKDGESVIMAEWATGRYYVEQWNNYVNLMSEKDNK